MTLALGMLMLPLFFVMGVVLLIVGILSAKVGKKTGKIKEQVVDYPEKDRRPLTQKYFEDVEIPTYLFKIYPGLTSYTLIEHDADASDHRRWNWFELFFEDGTTKKLAIATTTIRGWNRMWQAGEEISPAVIWFEENEARLNRLISEATTNIVLKADEEDIKDFFITELCDIIGRKLGINTYVTEEKDELILEVA